MQPAFVLALVGIVTLTQKPVSMRQNFCVCFCFSFGFGFDTDLNFSFVVLVAVVRGVVVVTVVCGVVVGVVWSQYTDVLLDRLPSGQMV